MVYWHLEKAGDLAQFDDFRLKKQPIEEAYLKLRTALRDTEAALRADPENAELQNRVEDLKKQLKELEQQAPWLTSDVAVELALWGTTHGLL
jgi:hypothetical protein